jgi:hypothetical protein
MAFAAILKHPPPFGPHNVLSGAAGGWDFPPPDRPRNGGSAVGYLGIVFVSLAALSSCPVSIDVAQRKFLTCSATGLLKQSAGVRLALPTIVICGATDR